MAYKDRKLDLMLVFPILICLAFFIVVRELVFYLKSSTIGCYFGSKISVLNFPEIIFFYFDSLISA